MIQDPDEDLGCLLEVVNGKTYLPVANVGIKDIAFKEEQCVGRAEEVELCSYDISSNEDSEKCYGDVHTVNLKERRPITTNDIKVDENLEFEKKQELLRLLNEYRDCFALDLSELGCTDLIKMDIKEVENSNPVCQRPYRTNVEERAAIKNIVQELEFEILHGYIPRFNDGILRQLADEEADIWCNPEQIQNDVKEKIEKEQKKMKEKYDKKKCRTMTFDTGEVVVVRRSAKSKGEPTKTLPKYRGPLVITEVLPNDTYRISQLEERTNGRFYSTTAHVSQLKSWKCEESTDDEPSSEEEETLRSDSDGTHFRRHSKRKVKKPVRYPDKN